MSLQTPYKLLVYIRHASVQYVMPSGKGGGGGNVVMSTGSGLLHACCCRNDPGWVIDCSCSSNIRFGFTCGQSFPWDNPPGGEFTTQPRPQSCLLNPRQEKKTRFSSYYKYIHVVSIGRILLSRGLDGQRPVLSHYAQGHVGRCRCATLQRHHEKQQLQKKRVRRDCCMETHLHACSLHNLACSVRAFII